MEHSPSLISLSALGCDRSGIVSQFGDNQKVKLTSHAAMKSPDKIIIVDRFAPLRMHLLALLAELREEEWARPTAAPGWSVKDVATHLLGGDIAILSGWRDRYSSVQKVDGYKQLVELVDRLNREWIVAARRFSPRLLCEFLAFTGPEVETCFSSRDPMSMGGPVDWAGPDPAPVWFDLAREFTERWHHQQQIRDATGRSPLYDAYFLGPVLDTFVRALPHAFNNEKASEKTTVRLEISGDAGGVWCVNKTQTGWTLLLDSPVEPATTVVIPQDLAWRLFTKGIDREKARSMAVIEGIKELAAPIFATTAIMG